MGNTLRADNITIAYNKTIIAENIDLDINKPQVISIIGPNGAGKSTLLKTLSRILPPQKGSVFLDGNEIQKMPGKAVARVMAMLPQSTQVPDDFLVIDLVSMGRTPYRKTFGELTKEDREIIRNAMQQTNTTSFHHRKVNTLSGGERQRVWLAMALAQEPKILLLDEPTTFLDIHHQFEIMELVDKLHKTLNITVIMVLHDLNHALRYSERIIAIKDKKIFADDLSENVLTEENFVKLYNVKAKKIALQEGTNTYYAFVPYEVCSLKE